jgi:hypothetical protein
VTRILNAAYGGKDVGDEVMEYYQDPLPPLNALLYMEPCRDFFCDYDIFKEAEKALSGEKCRYFVGPKQVNEGRGLGGVG